MTLRITLLVLVTGLFALIWTHDRQMPKPTDSRIASGVRTHHGPEPLQHEAGAQLRRRPVVDVPVVPASLSRILPEKSWNAGDAEMPLPAGLVPGEYRVVSNTGIVRNVTLTLEELQARHDGQVEFITRDVYQSQGAKLRWYFIRVHSGQEKVFAVIAERGTHVVRPAIAERGTHKHVPAIAEKDDSARLRQQASQIIVGAGGRFFRNMTSLVQDRREENVPGLLKDGERPINVSAEESGNPL